MILHWPQITVIVLAAIGVGIHFAKHGQPKSESYNGVVQMILVAIEFWLLYEGGFFGVAQ